MATEKETHQVRNMKSGNICHIGDHASCVQYVNNVVWLNVGIGRHHLSIETKGMK